MEVLRFAAGALLITLGGLLERRSFQRRRRIAHRDLPHERQLFAWKNVDVGWDFWVGFVLVLGGIAVLPI